MKFFKSAKTKYMILASVMILSIALIHIVQAATANQTPAPAAAASNDYVLVTQDYVDAKITALTEHVDELQQNTKFKPVLIKAGEQLVAGEGTEIVLRSGKATAVASANGGLSNIITGTELTTGDEIPQNGYLLISRNDGRGFVAVTDVWILIKGTFDKK